MMMIGFVYFSSVFSQNTRNDNLISINENYSFIAIQDREYASNFKKDTHPPAIDGNLDEEIWDITQTIDINVNNSDNTLSFGLLWDDNYLYVSNEVVNNSLSNGFRQTFYDDRIEICIDGNHSNNLN
jgi:hypothetical protein